MAETSSPASPDAVIAALEASRAVLGDAATDAAIAAVRATRVPVPPPAAPAAEHDDERKLVTIMFADASGFTALSEKLGAEKMRLLLNGCFAALTPVIEQAGGTIDKFIGDCVMALFGAPVAREDDAQRCCGAALDLMAALDAFNRRNGTSIGMHVGINTGEVIAGGVGGTGRQDYSVIGDAVNVAARLQDVAETGDIFVGPETARLACALYEFEFVSTTQLKGREQPVAIHRLVRRRATSDAIVGDGVAAGREVEVARILTALRDGAAGPPQRLLVIGEPGIGKSRLLAEARREADTAAAFVSARAHSSTTGTPYALFADSLARLSDSRIEQGAAAFAAQLETACRACAGDDAGDLFAPLALIAGLPLAPAAAQPLRGLAPDILHDRFATAYTRLARAGMEHRPLVLCFEDLHWADAASIAMIGQFARLSEPPALILMTARRDGVAALDAAGLERDADMLLQGLSPDDIALLTRAILGADAVGPALFRLLVGRSEGNPFFVEQLIATLQDADALERRGSAVELRADAVDVTLPASLHGLIQARLDQLSRPAKRTLQAAAAVGRTFPTQLIERIEEMAGSTAAETGGRLDDLAARDLLRRELAEARALAERQYAFRHAAIQEVAYGTLLEARKTLIHRAIAETLEAYFGEESQEFSLTLAHHFRCAGDDARAADYYLDGAARAAAIYAATEARGAYRKALDAYARLDAPEATRRGRMTALTGLGELCERAGEHEEARRLFGEALDLSGPLPEAAVAGLHRRIGLSSISQRQTAEAIASFDTALRLMGPRRDACEHGWWTEWIEIQIERLWAAYFSGDLAAMQAVRDEAGALVAAHGTLAQRSRFGKRVLLIAFREECLNISDATMAGARRSLQLSEELKDPDDLARAHFMVGFCSMWRGDHATAAAHFPRALDLARSTGNMEYQVMTASYTAVLHRKRGDAAEVAAWCERAEALAGPARMALYQSIARANRAWLAARAGAFDEVEALAAPVVASWAAAPWQLAWLAAWPLLAERIARGGDLATPIAAMLRPNQQRLGPAIEEPLRAAAATLEAGRSAGVGANLRKAREAAAALGAC